MSFLDSIKNLTLNRNRYRTHGEAAIVSCFFNPQRSPYRLVAFNRFYASIKHLNHLILECVIGNTDPQLPESDSIQRVYTENLLWHKESLINLAVSRLPARFKYIFWVDADVLFTNLNWLVDGVAEFECGATILQPFEQCVHLERDQVGLNPGVIESLNKPGQQQRVWRSFSANCVDNDTASRSTNYDIHGHVGFAWGATRELLEAVPLYDRALIGGADHIIAHAAVGQIPHPCIEKSFTEDLAAVYAWSAKFHAAARGRIAYVAGDLYHIWHGDIDKRQYLKRIKEFTPTTKQIRERDKNGLYVTKTGDDAYIRHYFDQREVKAHDDGFMNSMALAYMTDSTFFGAVAGGNPAGAMLGGMMRHTHNEPARHPIHYDAPQTKDAPHASENFS